MGLFAASKANAACVSLMRLSMLSQVSIVWLLLRCVLPLLIAVLAVTIHKRNMLPVLGFLHCFGFGYFLWLGMAAFGSGAWLAFPLLRLPDLVCFGLFCWICTGDGVRPLCFLRICIVLILLAVIADVRLVSPLRAMLLHS